MAIAQGMASIAVSAALGALKLGHRIDRILAEEEAVRSHLAMPAAAIGRVPSPYEMKKRLRALLRETEDQRPDPIGSATERTALGKALRRSSEVSAQQLEAYCERYGLDFDLGVVRPDDEVARLFAAHRSDWDLSDEDIRHYTYMLAAGQDLRERKATLRIATALLGVFAEFTQSHLEAFTRDPTARKVLTGVLTRFGQTQLESSKSWSELLHHALRATVGGVLEHRQLFEEQGRWATVVLGAVAHAREAQAGSEDFLLGLLRGEGLELLLQGALREASELLSHEDASTFERSLGSFLASAAALTEGAGSDFQAWFNTHWNELVAAALEALGRHGQGLLRSEDKLLERGLVVALEALADELRAAPPRGRTLRNTVSALLAMIAEEPELLEAKLGRAWARDLVASLARILRDKTLAEAFTAKTLHEFLDAGLDLLARHPELAIGASGLSSPILAELFQTLLADLAAAPTLRAQELASIVVSRTLRVLSQQPQLLDGPYGPVVGRFAGEVARLVAEKSLRGVEAGELLALAIEALAAHAEAFARSQGALPQALLSALAAGAERHPALLRGAALGASARLIFDVLSAHGEQLLDRLPKTKKRQKLIDETEAWVLATLRLIEARLGRGLDRRAVPQLLATVIEAWATGELDEIPPQGTVFEELFDALVASLPRTAHPWPSASGEA